MIKIEILPGGAKLVKRYRKGRCYGAVWSEDTNERQILSQMMQGVAAFFPWDESTNRPNWNVGNGRPSYFKR